jgi:ABC-type glycerol-3-phosphate transport system permease component
VPREIDETAYIDGYSFPRFFVKLFLPLIKAGIGVTRSSASCSRGSSCCSRAR